MQNHEQIALDKRRALHERHFAVVVLHQVLAMASSAGTNFNSASPSIDCSTSFAGRSILLFLEDLDQPLGIGASVGTRSPASLIETFYKAGAALQEVRGLGGATEE